MFRILTRAAKFTPAFAILLPLAAQAADRAFCAGYSDAAMEQVHRAMTHASCAGGARGARWARERRVHFDWCLGASPAAAAAERAETFSAVAAANNSRCLADSDNTSGVMLKPPFAWR